MTEYREWDYRNEILTTSKKWYRCDIAHCGRTFASERNCALHIHAHHPGRFRCDIGGCAAVFDLRTPFTRHVLKEHQQFVPDGAFTTASASKQKPAKAKRSRKIPEGFSLIDITSRLDFEPSDKQLFPLAPIPSPPSAVNSSDWASPRVGHPQSRPVGCPDTDRSSYDKNRRDIKRRVSLIEEPITYRVIRARLGKHRPDYEVHQSAIHPGQQCGIDWASEAGKLNFDRVFKSLIGRMGGVKPSHQGSCVLCPEALRSMNLSDLRGTDPTLLPDRTADPIKFYYSDYATSFPRATAWYQGGRWPRAGAELDGLIGANGLLPMDATYLCHQEHCVIHLAWESVEHKSSREHCAVSAREARQAGRPLPKHCSEHTPPCLLQHAALARTEVYLIQFDVREQATGLALYLKSDRPDVHRYPTFERRMPLSLEWPDWPVSVRSADLVAVAQLEADVERPNLICQWCPKVRALTTLLGFWTHIITTHHTVENYLRLLEIRRTAALWRIYGGSSSDQAMAAKMAKAESDSFCWADVEAWGLRSRQPRRRCLGNTHVI